MTVGLAEAAFRLERGLEVTLAVDFDESISKVYRFNFPKARVENCGVEEIFDGNLGDHATVVEALWRDRIGPVDILVGGPPCQGHSDLNNHTRRDDPRNDSYTRVARAAEVLKPRVVIIENVPPVRNDKGEVVDQATRTLDAAGFAVADRVIPFVDLGVPQRRRRHTVLGVRDVDVDPGDALGRLGGADLCDIRWAIGDLEAIET